MFRHRLLLVSLILLFTNGPISTQASDAPVPVLNQLRLDAIWDLTKYHARLNSFDRPPPIIYIPKEVRQDGVGAIGARYFPSGPSGPHIELYKTFWSKLDRGLADQYVYAGLAEEYFHHALTLKGVPIYWQHCVMVSRGFGSWKESGVFLDLLRNAESARLITWDAKNWEEEKLKRVCASEYQSYSSYYYSLGGRR